MLANFTKVFATLLNNPLLQGVGMACEVMLSDSAENSSKNLMFDMKSLGAIQDSVTKPKDRTEADKTRIASDIFSTHTIEMALHLAKHPDKIKKYKDKIKSYSQKTFDGIKAINQDLDDINTGKGQFTRLQDQHAKSFDPKSEAAAYMTQAALAGMFDLNPFGKQGSLLNTTLNLHRQMRAVKSESLKTRIRRTFVTFSPRPVDSNSPKNVSCVPKFCGLFRNCGSR